MYDGSLREVAALFLRLGATAFGGPAAHVALLEDEVVRKRAWLSRQEFLDLYSASNIIPGPNSTELAIHLGYRRAGWAGLVVAGVCFIMPAMLIVWLLAWSYVRFGSAVEVARVMQTLQPVVLAIVAQAIWRLGRTALVGSVAWGVAIASVIALQLGAHELLVLAVAALVALMARRVSGGSSVSAYLVPTSLVQESAIVSAGVASSAAATATSTGIFLSFAKIGSVLFGSGYVLLAFLRREFVERNAWLTDAQLIDAITIGQVTPGPVFTTATFVGYLLQGNSGAIAATLGIFLPAFFFVAVTARSVERLRSSPTGAAVLEGLNAASLALMASVLVDMGPLATSSPLSIAMLVIAFALLVWSRVGAGTLLLAAVVIGVVRQFM